MKFRNVKIAKHSHSHSLVSLYHFRFNSIFKLIQFYFAAHMIQNNWIKKNVHIYLSCKRFARFDSTHHFSHLILYSSLLIFITYLIWNLHHSTYTPHPLLVFGVLHFSFSSLSLPTHSLMQHTLLFRCVHSSAEWISKCN